MTFYADKSILAKIPGDLIARGGRHCRRQGLASLRRGPSLSDGDGDVNVCTTLKPAVDAEIALTPG